MKENRTIALPAPLNRWIEKESQRLGLSVSSYITYTLMKHMEDVHAEKSGIM